MVCLFVWPVCLVCLACLFVWLVWLVCLACLFGLLVWLVCLFGCCFAKVCQINFFAKVCQNNFFAKVCQNNFFAKVCQNNFFAKVCQILKHLVLPLQFFATFTLNTTFFKNSSENASRMVSGTGPGPEPFTGQ